MSAISEVGDRHYLWCSELIFDIFKNLTKILAYSQNGVGGDCARRVWIIPIPHLDRSLP